MHVLLRLQHTTHGWLSCLCKVRSWQRSYFARSCTLIESSRAMAAKGHLHSKDVTLPSRVLFRVPPGSIPVGSKGELGTILVLALSHCPQAAPPYVPSCGWGSKMLAGQALQGRSRRKSLEKSKQIQKVDMRRAGVADRKYQVCHSRPTCVRLGIMTVPLLQASWTLQIDV